MWRSRVALCAAVVGVAIAAPALGAVAITSYLDGAVVAVETAAKNGYCEVRIPSGARENSLRVKPVGKTIIDRVEVVADGVQDSAAGKTGLLEERKSRIEDRIKALETKEEIFRAAAKSQSGKAPRKTKTNPEPLDSIRKGTEYAIAQLEEVYRAKRKAEGDLKKVEQELAALNKGGKGQGQTARIWLRDKGGRALVEYLLPAWGWQPAYDVRLASASDATVVLRASLPSFDRDSAVSVAAPDGSIVRVAKGDRLPAVATYHLPVAVRRAEPAPRGGLDFTLTNSTSRTLLSGTASCFLNGVFVGKTSIPSIAAGANTSISLLP